jgi:3-deoxy-manno-octulosonate cytidylyltransferase (CMP-KDO synthetase)
MVKPVSSADEYHSADVVKAVLAVNGNALYFSRQSIPYFRKGFDGKKLQQNVYKHLGMYAYRAEVIKKIALLPVAPLEEAEQLEQLRWLQNGYTIRALLTNIETIAVDTPDDLKKAENFLNKK